MASLNSLKDRWEQHFKTSKNPALKSVLGRPSTPFRPRVSLLPRRCVRTGTDSLPDLVTGPVPRSGVESHGCSSSSQSGLPTCPAQEKEAQDPPIPSIPNVPAQLLATPSESASLDDRTKGPSCTAQEIEPQESSISQILASPPVAARDLIGSELTDCPQDPNPALNPPATVQESDIYIGNVKLQAEFVDTIAGAFLQSSRKTLHFVPRLDRMVKSSFGQQRR
ncbi:UNVERIFIED_CONTAM: hypothetical protein Sangu_3238100 [Sesamum angustifolium]|uniref:Uncharacterized protein n=1 Tax=Sesamum angustifolium TaxID=2727405 RepID=A0AAW2JIN1_9LAMI